jgi:hypothetical protein
VALAQMFSREAGAAVTHHPAKVKRVIQLFMTGGGRARWILSTTSPRLEKLHGQMLGPKEKPEGFTAAAGAMMKSPFASRSTVSPGAG